MPAGPVRDVAWPELDAHEGPSSCRRPDTATTVQEGKYSDIQPALPNLPAALGSAGAARETCTKEEKENPVRLVIAVKFLP